MDPQNFWEGIALMIMIIIAGPWETDGWSERWISNLYWHGKIPASYSGNIGVGEKKTTPKPSRRFLISSLGNGETKCTTTCGEGNKLGTWGLRWVECQGNPKTKGIYILSSTLLGDAAAPRKEGQVTRLFMINQVADTKSSVDKTR